MTRSSADYHGPLDAMMQEVLRAEAKYGDFRSSHEGYGVLAEEVAELLEAIRQCDGDAIRKEAIQVSAVALRLAFCIDQSISCRARSGVCYADGKEKPC